MKHGGNTDRDRIGDEFDPQMTQIYVD
jgi:hypothetical protein